MELDPIVINVLPVCKRLGDSAFCSSVARVRGLSQRQSKKAGRKCSLARKTQRTRLSELTPGLTNVEIHFACHLEGAMLPYLFA